MEGVPGLQTQSDWRWSGRDAAAVFPRARSSALHFPFELNGSTCQASENAPCRLTTPAAHYFVRDGNKKSRIVVF